jgi:hypothetical protein
MCDRFQDAFTSRPIDRVGPGSKFMEEFERIKHNFQDDLKITESIPLTMNNIDRTRINETMYNFDEDEVKVSW